MECSRITGKRTYDVLAIALYKIFTTYKIQNKIISAITDSGSNFVKAFKSYPVLKNSDEEEDNDDINDDGNGNINNDNINLFEILGNITHEKEEIDLFIQLPPHSRCASYKLDLMAKNYVDKIV